MNTILPKFDRSNIFTIVAIVTVTGILLTIFYTTAINSYSQIIMPRTPPGFGNFTPAKPPIGNYTGPFAIFPANVTHKIVTKHGWHACQDNPGVWCLGTYKVNETIIREMPFIPSPSAPPGVLPPSP